MRGIVSSRGPSGAGAWKPLRTLSESSALAFSMLSKSDPHLRPSGGISSLSSGRLDEGYVMAFKSRKLKRLFSQYIKENVLITTSASTSRKPWCVPSARWERIGFSCGRLSWVSMKEAVELIEGTPISDSDKEKIYHLNAERWLKL